jgi:hypothetical protein
MFSTPNNEDIAKLERKYWPRQIQNVLDTLGNSSPMKLEKVLTNPMKRACKSLHLPQNLQYWTLKRQQLFLTSHSAHLKKRLATQCAKIVDLTATPGVPPPPPPPPGFRASPPLLGINNRLQMPPVRQHSTRIVDITPLMPMDEAVCLKKLTTYAAYTIRKVPPRGKSGRGTWLGVEVTEERLP